MKYRPIYILIAAIFPLLFVNADTVITKDGSILHGTITLIDRGVVHIDTLYAGKLKLKLKQDEVFSFETETPIVVRLEDDSQSVGVVMASSDGKLKIQSQDNLLETNTSKIAASWAPDNTDPELARNSRQWLYEFAIDLNGKKGNTDKFHLGGELDVRLKGPDDEFRFAFEYEEGEQNGSKIDDRVLGRVDYERFNKHKVGWYVRDVLETDKIDNIRLRSTTGGGASYRFINSHSQTLVGRSGLGYRFTDFESADREDDSLATIEAAFEHNYKFREFCYLENKLYYSPALDDFGNYRATHYSSLKIPFGNSSSLWIRIGIKNEYENQNSAEERLDTSYYTKLVYSWK